MFIANNGLSNLQSSQPGQPGSFSSNTLNVTPEMQAIKTSQPANGKLTYFPGDTVSFIIDAGPNSGTLKRGSAYVTFELEATLIGKDIPYLQQAQNYTINKNDQTTWFSNDFPTDSALFSQIPRFKLNNPSAIKNSQVLRANNADIYNHMSQNILIEQYGVLNGKKDNNHRFCVTPISVTTPYVIRKGSEDGTKVRYNVSMALDCPILDHESQDFPAFLIRSNLQYSFKLETEMGVIFDNRTAPVLSYTASNFMLNYDVVRLGGAYEQNISSMLEKHGQSFEMVINSYISPNLIDLKGDAHQFTVHGNYSSIVSFSCAPYTTYTIKTDATGETDRCLFVVDTNTISKVSTDNATGGINYHQVTPYIPLKTLTEGNTTDAATRLAVTSGIYGGSGFYSTINGQCEEMNVQINGRNVIEQPLRPSKNDIRVFQENMKYASGTFNNNDGDMYSLNFSDSMNYPIVTYSGCALNCSNILDNDMSFPGRPSTGTINVFYQDNRSFSEVSDKTINLEHTHFSEFSRWVPRDAVVAPNTLIILTLAQLVVSDDQQVFYDATGVKIGDIFKSDYKVQFLVTQCRASSVTPGKFEVYGYIYAKSDVTIAWLRRLFTFMSFTRAININGQGAISLVH